MSHTFPHTIASQENANEHETDDAPATYPASNATDGVRFEPSPALAQSSTPVVPTETKRARVARVLGVFARYVAHNLARKYGGLK